MAPSHLRDVDREAEGSVLSGGKAGFVDPAQRGPSGHERQLETQLDELITGVLARRMSSFGMLKRGGLVAFPSSRWSYWGSSIADPNTQSKRANMLEKLDAGQVARGRQGCSALDWPSPRPMLR